eukprot:snap_masked-scaffold_26-processed-gene-2.18-mRNA-1 protein AED:1.00 eAED:1.00 QI:0/-1/0/0/-1/1/1/0/134
MVKRVFKRRTTCSSIETIVFQTESEIPADYKLKKDWTEDDRREYNARAVRLHRRRVRVLFDQEYKKEEKLVLDIQNCRQQIKKLKLEVKKLEFLTDKRMWSTEYLLMQNDLLRQKARDYQVRSNRIKCAIFSAV